MGNFVIQRYILSGEGGLLSMGDFGPRDYVRGILSGEMSYGDIEYHTNKQVKYINYN